MRGYGAFVGANDVEVEETTGSSQEKTRGKRIIALKKTIVAAASHAVRLLFMPENPRMVDSTGALALKDFPKRMLIPGRGIIGLEQGADRDLVGIW